MLIRYENGEVIRTNPKMGLRQLVDIDLHRAVLDHMDLSRYIFRKARGVSARFCDLKHADFEKASMMASHFSHSNLQFINANGAKAMFSLFTYSNLSSGSLRGADLRGCNFDNSNLLGCDFRSADLTDASFKNAKIDETTRWPVGYIAVLT